MALPGKQRRSGVEPDPAGARNIDLGPGMQVGEILGRAARAIQTWLVGGELDEVARHKSSCQAAVAVEPSPAARRVPTGAELLRECLIRSLDAVFHPDRIGDIAIEWRHSGREKLNRRLPVSCRKAATGYPFGDERALRRGSEYQGRA